MFIFKKLPAVQIRVDSQLRISVKSASTFAEELSFHDAPTNFQLTPQVAEQLGQRLIRYARREHLAEDAGTAFVVPALVIDPPPVLTPEKDAARAAAVRRAAARNVLGEEMAAMETVMAYRQHLASNRPPYVHGSAEVDKLLTAISVLESGKLRGGEIIAKLGREVLPKPAAFPASTEAA